MVYMDRVLDLDQQEPPLLIQMKPLFQTGHIGSKSSDWFIDMNYFNSKPDFI